MGLGSLVQLDHREKRMDTWAGLKTWRPVIMGRRGAVVTNHPLATEAGLAVLRQGGNAIDAYIAAATTVGVVEPHQSGIGGEGFALVYSAAEGKATILNASGRAPRAATAEQFHDGIPAYGPLTPVTPSLPDGWCAAHARWGTLPLSTLFESAIYHAREGFGATRFFCQVARGHARSLAADPEAARVFLPGGSPPELGTVIRQPGLARTLEAVAAGGRDAFYEGEIGQALVRWMQANGGLIDADDLKNVRSEYQEPIGTTYRGLEVLEAPPNSTGATFLQELNMAEQFDLRSLVPLGALPCDSPDLVHSLVEIKKLCFVDRERIADLDDPAPLLAELLSKEYAARLAAQIDRGHATPRPVGATPVVTNTTYLCTADEQGNAVSGIQSHSDSFGSCCIAGDTGVLLNNRMRLFHLEDGHANQLRPGRRVRHTLNPPMVLRDGRPYIVIGTPGFDAQLQYNLQVLTAIVDFGLDPQQAIEMARWQSLQPGTYATWPHEMPDRLDVENRMAEATRQELGRRGHAVNVVGPLEGGGSVNVLLRDEETGIWQAGADPRRDAYALAW
jgi:gamma-glutamyltranspeptidase